MKMPPINIGLHWQGRKASLPMTPPLTPEVFASTNHAVTDEPVSFGQAYTERVVLLYVGRM